MLSEYLVRARDALVAAGITGPHQSHSRPDNLNKIRALVDGDQDAAFGLDGFDKYSAQEVLSFLSELTGCSDDIDDWDGADTLDPGKTVNAIVDAAERLRLAAGRGATMLVATGHPTGLLEHHIRVVDAYRRAGGKIVRLREEERFPLGRGHAEIRYIGNVGCLAKGASLVHTHSAEPMEAMLEAEPWPDLVLADHGYAGAAIVRGIPVVAAMDINDPALAVAWAERPDEVTIIPFDDNRPPRLYEPSWTIFEDVLAGREL
ncbi:MAG: phosphatase [Actinomycetota bacterium]|nr:phosphatase [Actinomycetota bacterium]